MEHQAVNLSIWRGEPALAPYRLAAVVAGLKSLLPKLGELQVEADWLYVHKLSTPFTPQAERLGGIMLSAKPGAAPRGGFIVAPRKGTITPWSTKATSALHNAGLDNILRVERAIHYTVHDSAGREVPLVALTPALHLFYNRMSEGIYASLDDHFVVQPPAAGQSCPVMERGREALVEADAALGLALSSDEIDYLLQAYQRLGRNPTDTELVMFGQVNSEHCRHKIFNASWTIDGEARPHTLFGMIRHTHKEHPAYTLSAYHDNAAVAEGHHLPELRRSAAAGNYSFAPQQLDLVMKVETHNHPTAVAPFPGAATGVGGEIRDENATGRGGESLAGLAGMIVSNLRIPGHVQPWERELAPPPHHLASPLEILLQAARGGAAYSNEIGRPQLIGLLRTYEEQVDGRLRGYHKPIMIAGGMGAIRRALINKESVAPGALLVQIGGPAMRIGLGGGAASSLDTAAAGLDFDSVQRSDPTMQRRCIEVIDACVKLGAHNPICSIHDVGAGGLSNAFPELVAECGATFHLRQVASADPSLSPLEIWCCEAQERYVLAIHPEARQEFAAICARERCPVAFVGVARADRQLILEDSHFGDRPIDMPLELLLGKPPRMERDVTSLARQLPPLQLDGITPLAALERILRLPAVGSKAFLITATDRSATGLVHRDQLVGPWQLPLADCAVTMFSHTASGGSAMALGERTPVALINAPASARLAIAEAITNLMGCDIGPIERIKLSANWMAACGEAGEDADLYRTVEAVGLNLCPALGISIPVGKDSLSMRTRWEDEQGQQYRQTSPLSLLVTAFARVEDVTRTITPDLKAGASSLLLLDLSSWRNRLGGSALAQVYNQTGDEAADLDDPGILRRAFTAIQQLVAAGQLLACHDRSDGGVAVTLIEMAIAGGRGLLADLPGDPDDPLPPLYSEEPGLVIQVANSELAAVRATLDSHGLADNCARIATVRDDRTFILQVGGKPALQSDLTALRTLWSETNWQLQRLQDNPATADAEFALARAANDPGLSAHLTFDPDSPPAGKTTPAAPQVALLRAEGLCGYTPMAAALTQAGFEVVDLHLSDMLHPGFSLDRFAGLVASGTASYGDIPAPGSGWAHAILAHDALTAALKEFFQRPDTFTLGTGNGSQMLRLLAHLMPGADHWPHFADNYSGRFEARLVTVELQENNSPLLRGMAGSRLPVVVSHNGGAARFAKDSAATTFREGNLAALRYVDNHGRATNSYPFNPDGSDGAIAGFTNRDGRIMLLMPLPERAWRREQLSYLPTALREYATGPWLRLFQNARNWVGAIQLS